MSLREYDDLAGNAGIANGISSVISSDSLIGIVIKQGASSFGNKAVMRTFMVGIVCFYFVLFFGVFLLLGESSEFLMFPLFCLGPFIVGGVVIGGHSLLMNTLMGLPETFMSTVVLRRGDELLIHYTQPIKRSVTLNSIAFTLMLRESATYDQGTSTVTVTHDHIIDQTLEADVQLSSDSGIDRQLNFTIPSDAMHTFEAYRNSLHWYVKVELNIPNFPDFHKNYKVKVLAEANNDES
jgi:hypothetical protein